MVALEPPALAGCARCATLVPTADDGGRDAATVSQACVCVRWCRACGSSVNSVPSYDRKGGIYIYAVLTDISRSLEEPTYIQYDDTGAAWS